MKILIVYYSLYGHVFKLAQAVKEGVESVKGAEVLFRRVEEFDICSGTRSRESGKSPGGLLELFFKALLRSLSARQVRLESKTGCLATQFLRT